MAYPDDLDTIVTPAPHLRLGLTTPTHHDVHEAVATAIVALETKVGIIDSTPTTVGDVLTVTAAGETEWQAPSGGGASLTGTPGGAGVAGGDIVITGGTGDAGNDLGAQITVGGGSGTGDPGYLAIVSGGVEGADGEVLTTDGSGKVFWGPPPTPTLAQVLVAGAATGGTTITVATTPVAPGDPTTAFVRGVNSGSDIGGQMHVAGADGGGGAALLGGGDGDTGNPGGDAVLYGGYGAGSDAGASITVHGGDGAGNAGTIEVITGGLTFHVIGGTADPSAGSGVAANIGSQYVRDNSGTGELWFKTGAADTAWTKVI